ncbi:MAG: chromate efflux transporter [Candidatus Sericytochromatia bacterium]
MTPLTETAWVFFKLGVLGFGGPTAHIALMKQECVERRQWLSEAEFLDLLGITHLIPGPNSTEMAIHLGFRRAGWPGLIVAGLCFILPAMIMVMFCARAYVFYGHLPAFAGLLNTVKPVILAVVLHAIAGLLKPALKNRWLKVLVLLVLGLALLGIDELGLLFGAGLLTASFKALQPSEKGLRRVLFKLYLAVLPLMTLPTLLLHWLLPTNLDAKTALPFALAPLFGFFLKVGALLYGSGYVLLAFLHETLVTQWQWLNPAQLLDAILIGQVTPGPVFTTATFIGYLLGGPWAAAVATLAIFLPSFLLVALSQPLVTRLRQFPLTGLFLDGVNAASLALMGAVILHLAQTALTDLPSLGICAVSLLLLQLWRVNSAWLILGAACLGWIGRS